MCAFSSAADPGWNSSAATASPAPWRKSGIKLYHLAYLVKDLPVALESLKSQGARVVVSPVPAAAFGGRHISFVMLPNLLLVELIAQ